MNEFPTQGDILKFAYDAVGILPRKHGDERDWTETGKNQYKQN
ncbi:hypothetical protein [Paludibacterium denitrificans]|nr:hypothetical protein [Paludibacterium denitrificans]